MAPIDIDWKKVLCDEEPQREDQTPRRRRRRLASPEQQEDVTGPRRDTPAEQAAGEDRVQAPGAAARPPVRASSKAAAEPPRQGSKEASPEEIFEALREIPDLDRADLRRAYSLLLRDDRRFRALMVLPKDMRKEWLLMEIDWEQIVGTEERSHALTLAGRR